MNFVGVGNVVARAAAPVDAEAAAVLQGIAHHFVAGDRAGRTSRPTAGGTGVITQMRRTTTALLVDALGEARLHELRARGDAMDNDQAVAYALDAIARARSTMENVDS